MFEFFRRHKESRQGRDLYFAILAQARNPAFFARLGVPDTLDGRFDMVVLHAALVFRRLKTIGPRAAALADATFEVMTADLDRSVRELGVGDLGVAKRVKNMARAFYGRAEAYDRALNGEAVLTDALRRNVYGTVGASDAQLAAMSAYVRAAATNLDCRTLEALAAGLPEFPGPPAL